MVFLRGLIYFVYFYICMFSSFGWKGLFNVIVSIVDIEIDSEK